ncbi:MAG: 30S ribosomal protein S15 [Candidatus Roizmanbacteria bacterium]|nr:30S ribosomal protein S15 [Candidatus Roizmanbacteria bacterium]
MKKSTVKKAEEPKKADIQNTAPTGEDKQKIITLFSTKQGDTGSPEVQVAILTWKVLKLQEHLGQNPKDNHSRRGLLKIISKRRRILNYIKSQEVKRYDEVSKKIADFQASYSTSA